MKRITVEDVALLAAILAVSGAVAVGEVVDSAEPVRNSVFEAYHDE